jgi:5'-nucleotidase
MQILISNDDGIYAKGIQILAEHLAREGKHQVTVVAPDRQKSASGHAITLHKPLHLEEVKLSSNYAAFKVNGTPADCVKMGIHIVLDRKPDLVISGINAGPNLGTDVVYSGTVSAAAEAAMSGIPAIAVSACGWKDFRYKEAARCVEHILDRMHAIPFQRGNILNINIPSAKETIRGMRITILGERAYSTDYERRLDPLGRPYYWLIGQELTVANAEDTDIEAVHNGYISVTPLRFELTDHTWFHQLQQVDWNLEEESKGT